VTEPHHRFRQAMTTFRAYPDTVSEIYDRRAHRKAQTREQIRTVGQGMFAARGFEAVTIADIAREAEVAVQTVFNHFATKEEIFFDCRIPWVDGPADAVRFRAPGVPALSALRIHLVSAVQELVGSHSTPQRRCYLATLQASDTLRTQERELVHEAELRLSAALLEAWTAGSPPDRTAPDDPHSAAPLVAATWVAASRALIHGRRPHLTEGADPAQAAAAAAALADRVFGQLEHNMVVAQAPVRRPAGGDTGWPHVVSRRAG